MKKNSVVYFKKRSLLAVLSIAGALLVSAPQSGYAGFEWRPPQDIVDSAPSGDAVTINRPESNNPVQKIDPIQVQRSPLPQLSSSKNAFGGDSQKNNLPMFNQKPQPQSTSTLLNVQSAPLPTGNMTPSISGGPVNFDKKFQRNSRQPLDLKGSDGGAQIVVEGMSAAKDYKNYQSDLEFAEPVEGFGRQIPLSIALRQIAPVEYEFMFEDGIDTGDLVNWEGGKSWKVVLKETLERKDLSFVIQENMISIRQGIQQPLMVIDENGSGEELRSNILSQISSTQSADTQTPLPTGTAYQDAKADLEEVQVLEAKTVTPKTPSEAVRDSMTNKKMGDPYQVSQMNNKKAFDASNDPSLSSVNARIEPAQLPTVAFQKPVKPINKTWFGAKGSSLRDVLADWSGKANVELYWDSEFDYPLQATVVVSGSFEEAVTKILEGFDSAQPRPLGRLHKNNSSGPPVLIVEANDLIQ